MADVQMAGMARRITTTMFSLKDNPTVESLDKVPEDFRGLYAEDDTGAGFRIKPEQAPLAAVIVKLQGSLYSSREAERKNRGTVDTLEGWKKLGETPETVQEQLADLQAKLEGASGKKEDLERFKEEHKAAHGAQLKARDDALVAKDAEIQKMKASLESHLIVSTATQAIANAKGYNELLMPTIRDQTRVVTDEAGKHVVQVLDEQGSPRFNGATMEPLTIPELVEEMKASEVFGRAFQPTGTSGGGAKPSGGAPPRPLGGTPGNQSPKDMISEGLAARDKGK